MDEQNERARPDNQGLSIGNIGELTGRDLHHGITSSIGKNDGPMCDANEGIPAGISQSRMHNISIHSLDFGFNVKIGCQNFAVETVDKLIKNLEAYLNDPSGTERKWMNERKLL